MRARRGGARLAHFIQPREETAVIRCNHRFAALLCAALLAMAPTVKAGDLPAPEGEVLLTVTGAPGATNAGEEARFDRAMLEALGTRTIRTTTPWTDGAQSFRGTPLAALLERLGIEDGELMATAVNDYSVTIPVESVADTRPMIAFERNGRAMSLRNKGPLWIVYAYDSDPALRSKVIYSRSIWQLDRLHAAP